MAEGERGALGAATRCPPAAGRFVIVVLVSGLLGAMLPAASGDSGGPDNYGYRWFDSKQPNPGVVYGWIDGVTGGTDLFLDDDTCTFTRVPFQFPFRFYGVIYNDVNVCANGFLAFNTPASRPEDTDAFAAAFGEDLNPAAPGSGHVFAKSDTLSSPRRFIVTWDGVYLFGTTAAQKFEIILTEDTGGRDGQIKFQYASLTSPPAALVGIQNIGGTSSLYYTSPLEDLLAVLFLPPGTAPPGDTLTVRGTSLAPFGHTVEPGAKDVPILRLNVSTATNSVNLRRVRVDVTGITSLPGDVSRISLWRDADGDGQLNTSLDVLLAVGTPSGVPETTNLALSAPLLIPAGPGRNLIVAFNISLDAVPGDWIGAGVLGPSYVTVDAPDNVSAANFPINTYLSGVRTQIVEGADTLRVISWSATNPTNVTQWQTDVPMLVITLDADKGAVTVTQITVGFQGTVPSDVYLAKVFEDTNRDLVLQPGGDRLLSRRTFDATGNVSLAVGLRFIAESPRALILSFDIAPNATSGDLVGARIADPAAFGILGSQDRVDPGNLPVATPSLSTVQPGPTPAIESRWAVVKPTPDGQILTGEYILSSSNSRDLSILGGNSVAARLTVENDMDYAYIVYDAVGDVSSGVNDSASIAFQTNRTAFPLAPPDDEFGTGGPMGPFHAVWNASVAAWTIEDACSSTVDTNHTGLACIVGFGRSPLSSTFHRIYEFQIPLRLLEVPLPILAGYTLGFAAASNWSRGVEDRNAPGNSSWPLVDPPAPPLWYGLLRLADTPPVNNPPRLDWTGEPGFVGDGVSPDTGTTLTTYAFRINYTDVDGHLPALGDPGLHVLQGASEIAGSPFSMGAVDPGDRDVTDGKLYETTLTFSACPRSFSHFFTAWDDIGANATPTPVTAGPQVQCPPSAPDLRNGTVAPTQGFANLTNFTWSIEYRDADGDPPARVELTIRKAGSPLSVLPLGFLSWLGTPNNYTMGALFGVSRNLSAAGADYTFSFLANDGLRETNTPPAAGPNVIPEPADELTATPFHDAPVVADAGQRNVKLFTLVLQAGTNSVSLVGLRTDRTGASVDSDVAAVRLINDVDFDGFPSGADALLGEGPLTGGRVVFSGFQVDVTVGSPVQLIVLVDIAPGAVADARVALRVLNAAYFQVIPPDNVATFPAFASTPVLINRPAVAVDLAADGFRTGNPAVLHLTNPQPRLEWNFFDANNGDVQTAYNVSLLRVPVGWIWSANYSGGTGFVVYNGSGLADGETYRMEVRVHDGRIWGPPASLVLRLNTPPPVPILSGPPDNAVNQGPTSVTLQWNPVTDPEADVVSYRWTLATRADFVGAISGTTPPAATSAVVGTVGATKYYWRMEAFDQYEWGPPSGAWSFTTHATSGRVFGRVTHAGAGLLAVVQLYNSSGILVNQTTTSATGTGGFDIPGVPFGVYEVRVTSQGYEPKTVLDVTIDAANILVDLGDIEMVPTREGGLDWGLIALYGLLIGAIAAAIAGAAVVARRRGREASEPKTTPHEGPAAPAPIPLAAAPMPSSEKVLPDQEPEFECPECGTDVTAEAKSCPSCGAIFE